MARTSPLASKADFVRKHPDLTPTELVAKAKAEGIRIIPQYVSNIRFKDKHGTGTRKPGRPRKADADLRRARPVSAGTSSAIVAEIERIVERKVAEILQKRLGGLVG